MTQTKQTITQILMNLLNTCKKQVEQNVDKEKLIKTLTDEAVSKIKDYATNKGVPLNDDVIDVDPVKEIYESGPMNPDSGLVKKAEQPPVPKDWFGVLRYYLNKGVKDLFNAIKWKRVGEILTLDVKKLFKLDERDGAVVDSFKEIGSKIGSILEKLSRIPVISPVFGKIAEILAAVGCKTINNRKLIIETEFATKNLQELMEFGLRHDQLTAIANAMFKRLNELDQEFLAQVSENEALKARVLSNIAAAHARVNAEIDNTSKRLTQGADQFDADMQNLINKI